MGVNEVPSYDEPQTDDIANSMENLNLDIPMGRRTKRTRKLNPRYYNQDILTDFDK